MTTTEGFIDAGKGKVWYEIVGEGNKTPIIVIHGGPAYPHDYLEPFRDLANDRQVVFYDQLGCGNSEWTTDKSAFTLDYYTGELETLIKHLGFKEYIILGQSWGTTIAANFAIKNPPGLKLLILANPFLDIPLWTKQIKEIINTFPESVQKGLKQPEESEEYKNAMGEFLEKYLYGVKDLPTAVLKSEHKMNPEVEKIMFGPNFFEPNGPSANISLSNKLKDINVPTLLFCGRIDETTPEATEYFTTLIPDSRMRIFENSAHFPFWTEREECINFIREFINENE
ncbi:MAG TPA: proline iminopeptidase-family hydrolase [Patescibacteria group bacterium]|nr:proline iminopeptidase-family hydrolase [Patescibacteria group bacterium]